MRLTPMGIPGKAPAHVKAWTQQEDELLITMYPDHTVRQIMKRLQRSQSSVKNRMLTLRERGLIGTKKKPLTKEMIAFLIRNRHVKSARELADVAGCCISCVKVNLRKRGYNLRKTGENHHCARHSDRLVELVAELRDNQNMTFRMIAEHLSRAMQMHLTTEMVYHLCHRRTAADAVLCELLPD
ncbi:DNA-binding protein [Escherichia coli]|nr:DNA-binding protein [Escherichia coli]